VQGPEAPAGIVRALEQIQRDGRAQLVILARGGGSAEDLACFNDERVARAIYACKVPVISSVGHETDWTIADLVADVRAPTPSAAAELCAPSVEMILSSLDSACQAAADALSARLQVRRDELVLLSQSGARHSPQAILAGNRAEAQRLVQAASALQSRTLALKRSQLDVPRTATAAAVAGVLSERRRAHETLAAFARGLDPMAVIKRGFAAIEHPASLRPVVSAAVVTAGDHVSLRLHDGRLAATIDRVTLIGKASAHGLG
jgi:exodeoxyribonuclease VII large subunit